MKMKNCLCFFCLVLTSLCLVQIASADQWNEVGEAGDLLGTAQVPIGDGLLTSITGTSVVNGPNWLKDVDMYKIYVSGATPFSAETVDVIIGGYLFSWNTKLFLFDSAGLGVFANDDQDDTYLPAITSTNLAAGFYYLATAPVLMKPVSASGQIFPDIGTGLLSPTGPGGSQPVIGWTGDSSFGAPYQINLTGAYYPQSVPEPSTILLLGLGLIGLAGVRRKLQK